MGWLRDFFHPGPYEIDASYPEKTDEQLLREGLDRGDVHWVVWSYVRYMPVHFGPDGFYDWMKGLRMGLHSGEIDRKEILELLGLEEN